MGVREFLLAIGELIGIWICYYIAAITIGQIASVFSILASCSVIVYHIWNYKRNKKVK